jgi:predicted phage terminase large subunit-like protein
MPTTISSNASSSLFDECLSQMQRELVPDVITRTHDSEKKIGHRTVDRIPFREFIEATSGLTLEPWQVHLANRLEKLTYQKGQRILLHKPPQHGGSVIVSQRLPAYLIGSDPYTRVKLACHNIDKSVEHTTIDLSIMQSAEYRSMFADNADLLAVPSRASAKKFTTAARKKVRDGQPSLMALGLATGFVGQGADHLIIDDPYASETDALSKAINRYTWSFWEGTAKVRIDNDTNVIVMFHRYQEEDFTGRLILEDGLTSTPPPGSGRWELISYRAQWDGDDRPEVGGPDPINREEGEYLSARKNRGTYYEDNKQSPRVWQAQFQGKPSNADGDFFAVSKFDIIPKLPVPLIATCRAWDIASSPDGDWTVGVWMGLGTNENVYVLNVVRVRKNTDERNTIIRQTSILDRQLYPRTRIRMPQDPAAAGKDNKTAFTKLLKGFDVVFETVKGDKELRADPWSQYVNAGLVHLISGEWNKDYIDEHRKFPNSGKKDQIDASSDAFSEIALEIEGGPGVSIDTMGFQPDDPSDNQFLDPEDMRREEEANLLRDYFINQADIGAANGYYYAQQEDSQSQGKTRIEGRHGESASNLGQAQTSGGSEKKGNRKVKVRRIRSQRSDQYRPSGRLRSFQELAPV